MANKKQDTDTDTLPEMQPNQKAGAENTEDRQAGEPITERGGPKGPEPTRFGDWENNGRCTDF